MPLRCGRASQAAGTQQQARDGFPPPANPPRTLGSTASTSVRPADPAQTKSGSNNRATARGPSNTGAARGQHQRSTARAAGSAAVPSSAATAGAPSAAQAHVPTPRTGAQTSQRDLVADASGTRARLSVGGAQVYIGYTADELRSALFDTSPVGGDSNTDAASGAPVAGSGTVAEATAPAETGAADSDGDGAASAAVPGAAAATTHQPDVSSAAATPALPPPAFIRDPSIPWAVKNGRSLDEGTQHFILCLHSEVQPEFQDKVGQDCGEYLYGKANRLLSEGKLHQAYPYQCTLAAYSMFRLGPDHPDTVQLVNQLTVSTDQRAVSGPWHYVWLLPRAAQGWGVGHPEFRQLVQRAANVLTVIEEPESFSELVRVVIAAAEQLPGGLGWGNTVVAPVPDEGVYNKHVIMQAESSRLTDKGEDAAAGALLQRCVAYYESLGDHWLGTPRKIYCMTRLAQCALDTDTPEQVESALRQAKSTGLRELGLRHPATLEATWVHTFTLFTQKRNEQALSLVSKTLRLLKEAYGPLHHDVLGHQVCVHGKQGVTHFMHVLGQAATPCYPAYQCGTADFAGTISLCICSAAKVVQRCVFVCVCVLYAWRRQRWPRCICSSARSRRHAPCS